MFKQFKESTSVEFSDEKKGSVSEILKVATKMKNTDGYEKSILYLEKVLESNLHPERECIRVVNRIVEYMKKATSLDAVITYLMNYLSQKNIYDTSYIELHCKCSDLLFQKESSLGIQYLERLLTSSFVDYEFSRLYQHLAAKFSDAGKFQNAYDTYNLLIEKLNPNEAFQFQRHYCGIAFDISELLLNLRPDNWKIQFVKFRVAHFTYSIISDIDMGMMGSFFHRRQLCYSGEWGKDESLSSVLVESDKNSSLEEKYKLIFDFAFIELPAILNLPDVCLSEMKYKEFRASPSFIKEYMRFRNQLSLEGQLQFDENGFEALKPFSKFREIEHRINEITQRLF